MTFLTKTGGSLLAVAVMMFGAALTSCQNHVKLEDFVDPTIGGIGVNLNPTKQTVQLPNSMVRFAPSRYDITDEQVSCYPLSQGSHRLESFFGFLPLPSDTPEDGIWDVKQITDAEKVRPSLYSSRLEGCSIQMAPTAHGGVINVSFKEDGGLIRLTRLCDEGGSFTDLGGGAFSGTENFSGMHAYVYAETVPPAKVVSSCDRGVVMSAGKNTVFRYALSYISPEQAKENFSREVPATLKEAAEKASASWKSRLGKIKVEGGTLAHKRSFYTALYRCSERMVNINEYGRYYSNYDQKVHESDRPFYVDNWIWDLHVALEPLFTIIEPKLEGDKLQSYVEMYKQCGTMPSFAEVWGDWPAMLGNFAAVWMADAASKGLNFDLKTGYEGLKTNSLDRTLFPWLNGPKNFVDDFYNENGYFPGLRPGEKEPLPGIKSWLKDRQSVSVTTGNSYCDWAIARIADSLGLDEDRELFTKRASYWKNVFRIDKGHMWPKDAEGKWIESFDPMYSGPMSSDGTFEGNSWFCEDNGYTFDWDVKHDLDGLFAAMGGREKAIEKLDSLFHNYINTIKPVFWRAMPDMSGLVGQFSMGNEPSFHIPYLYNYLGQPWKTQKIVHKLIDWYFTDTVLGIPGDEDGGGMSAFAVFTMAGFFQMTPGIPVYTIGSPFFEKVTISLQDGKEFTIKAKNFSEDNPYIQGATLNGKPLEKCFFTHKELTDGGELVLVMGPEPNKNWGSDLEAEKALPYKYNTVAVHSDAMNSDVRVQTIVPKTVGKESRFPVVYLVHGAYNNGDSWFRLRPDLGFIADSLGFIFVMPDVGNSWYLDSPSDPSCKYETFVSKELVSYVDANLPSIPRKEGRAISGISMGGHGAMYLALRHKDVFGAAESMSGALDFTLVDATANMMPDILGEDISHRSEWRPYTAIGQIDKISDGDLALSLDCGTEDFVLECSTAFHEALLKKGIGHDFTLRPGTHNDEYWRNSIDYNMLFLSKYFKHSLNPTNTK